MDILDGRKIAILATNGFKQSKLVGPRRRLRDAGAAVEVMVKVTRHSG